MTATNCLTTEKNVVELEEPTQIAAGLKKHIHVNQHIIRQNKKTGETTPVVTVRHKNKIYRCRSVQINGPSLVVYSPDKPLSCGARVWIETTSQLELE
jgi:hypothetical protein